MADAIDPNAGTGETPVNEEANLAKQELADMKARFEKLEKQTQGQSATIRKMTEALETLAKKAEPAEEKPKGPMASKLAEFESFKKAQEAKDAAQEAKLTRARMTGLMRSVEGQFVEAGVKPSLAKLAAETIAGRIKNQVTFDESGPEEVAVVKSGDDAMSVTDYVANFIASDDGKELLPEKEKPTLSGFRGKGSAAGKGKLRVTQSDLISGRFKLDDVVAGRVVLADG